MARDWRPFRRAAVDRRRFPVSALAYATKMPAPGAEKRRRAAAAGGANHIHSVWRDFDGDFGADLVAGHHRRAHRAGSRKV